MKAKVIETGEIIDVMRIRPIVYSRLNYNGKIIEEYNDYELEFIHEEPNVKMVSLDKVCEFLKEHLAGYDIFEDDIERSIETFKLAMED